MDIEYKSVSCSFKNPKKYQHRTNNEAKNLFIEHIKALFFSEEQEKYDEMKELIITLNNVVKESPPLKLYDILSSFPIIKLLTNAINIPQIENKYILNFIYNLIAIEPEIYQQEILQFSEFINYLFQTVNENEADEVYECINVIYNLVEGFQSDSELLLSNLNFNSLLYFALEKSKNAKICLKLMKKIVCFIKIEEVPIDVTNDILKIFIKMSRDIFDKYKKENDAIEQNFILRDAQPPEPQMIHEVMCFINEMIDNYFLSVIPVSELVDDIFEYIDDGTINLIFAALGYYTIVIRQAIDQNPTSDQPTFFEISKQIISEVRISDITEWVKNISPYLYSCHIGYTLLSLLIIYQELFEIDAINEISESSVVGDAIDNIKKSSFKQQMTLFGFIIAFIKNANPEIISDDVNCNMYFGLFQHLFDQSFNIDEMLSVVDLFKIYITKFLIIRSAEDLLDILDEYGFYETLDQMKNNEEYNDSDTLVGNIDTILNIFSGLSSSLP